MRRRLPLCVTVAVIASALSACDSTSPMGSAPIGSDAGRPAVSTGGGGGLGGPGADALVGHNAATLSGQLFGPAAGLVANNAGNLIANNASNVIGNNAARLVSNNSASLVAAASRFGLLATSALFAPVPGARVAVFDAQGQMRSDGWQTADAEGGFSFTGLPGDVLWFVRAEYSAEGQNLSLAAIVSGRMAAAGAIEVDPATTLVTKKIDALMSAGRISASAVDTGAITTMSDALAAGMSARSVAAAAVLSAREAEAIFDEEAKASPTVASAIAQVARPSPAGPASSALVADYAGDGTPGFLDGPAAAARFRYPYGIAVASDGTAYVSDFQNNCIRRIASDGTVTTLAGSDEAGLANGLGPAARFNGPRGLALGVDGTLYVADAGNSMVRRVTADGYVSTVVGVMAGLNQPRGVAVDRGGTVYVADTGNLRIRAISPAGDVTTVAELPAASDASEAEALAGPYGLAVDALGTVYVADTARNAIRRVGAAGRLETVAGGEPGFADGQGSQARFHGPVGIAVRPDGTGLVVVDFYNHSLRAVTPNGVVTTLAGDGQAGVTNGPGATARFYGPYAVAAAPDGSLYVADTSNQRIRRVD